MLIHCSFHWILSKVYEQIDKNSNSLLYRFQQLKYSAESSAALPQATKNTVFCLFFFFLIEMCTLLLCYVLDGNCVLFCFLFCNQT